VAWTIGQRLARFYRGIHCKNPQELPDTGFNPRIYQKSTRVARTHRLDLALFLFNIKAIFTLGVSTAGVLASRAKLIISGLKKWPTVSEPYLRKRHASLVFVPTY
jgi:hypothetical protein